MTRKYQVTIPKAIRETIGVCIGDELLVNRRGRRIVLEKRVRPNVSLRECEATVKGRFKSTRTMVSTASSRRLSASGSTDDHGTADGDHKRF